MKENAIGPVILDLEGLTLTSEEKEILTHPNVGGVIFFSRNYADPQQLTDLVKQIRSIKRPCLLCVDQEGGRVQRFIKDFTRLPALQTLGNLLDNQTLSLEETLSLSEQLGHLMALEIRAMDIDLSFAPVLDLGKNVSDVIQDRAFHSDPQTVAHLATAYIKGMAKAGMKATGKHFPGHGSVKADSHFFLPEDQRSLAEIGSDLFPFQFLIEQNMAALMPAHIIYPHIDPAPVGFSSYWLQTILREQLQFQGTIVSDDLMMAGATTMGEFPLRAQRALAAGCDYILICNHRPSAILALEGIKETPNLLTQQRRQNLLATQEVPAWPEIRHAKAWQAGIAALEQLNELKAKLSVI